MARYSVRKPGRSRRKDLGDIGGAVTISKDLQDCQREKILLGPVGSGHTGTLSLLTTGQS